MAVAETTQRGCKVSLNDVVMRPFLRFLDLIFLVSLDTLRKTGVTDMDKLSQVRVVDQRNISCIHERYINGCTIPLDMKFFYKDDFSPACDIHDVCYFCGVQYGWSRKSCDEDFLRNMELICQRNSDKDDGVCSAFAKLYYVVVRIFSEEHYHIESLSWCQNTCVKKHGVPADMSDT